MLVAALYTVLPGLLATITQLPVVSSVIVALFVTGSTALTVHTAAVELPS